MNKFVKRGRWENMGNILAQKGRKGTERVLNLLNFLFSRIISHSHAYFHYLEQKWRTAMKKIHRINHLRSQCWRLLKGDFPFLTRQTFWEVLLTPDLYQNSVTTRIQGKHSRYHRDIGILLRVVCWIIIFPLKLEVKYARRNSTRAGICKLSKQ